MTRRTEIVVSSLLNEPDENIGINALRRAIRTQPREQWDLTTASRAMYGTRDYDRLRARSCGFNWGFVGEQLDALVDEYWLHRPDGVLYVPTKTARSTWPTNEVAS